MRCFEIARITSYIEVLKPLPTILLAFIGISAAFIAAEGEVTARLWLVLAAVLAASAGANGLTNYLDRDIDARMERTNCRALPSGDISPPQKALPLIGGLIIIGLALAWWLNPLVFWADLGGTLVAATWRKKVTCVYPQGVLASCAPLFMGWLAIKPVLSWEVLVLCVMIAAWLPLHVWSVNIAHRQDYLQAGLRYFPLNLEVKDSVKVLLLFSLVLFAASYVLYFIGGLSWPYLAVASILGIMMVYGSARLVISGAAGDAWRLYRLSSFPYLGIMFLAICLDILFVQ